MPSTTAYTSATGYTSDATRSSSGGSSVYTPPQITISGIVVTDIGPNSVRVVWQTTGQLTTSQVKYGLTVALGSQTALADTPAASAGVESHSVVVSGLDAATLYHFKVESGDNTTVAVSDLASWTTAAAAGDLSNVTLTDVSGSTLAAARVTATFESIGVELRFTGDTANTVTVPHGVLTLSAGASAGATSLSVGALPCALPDNQRLMFKDAVSGAAKLAVLNGAAAKGATSLTVDALASAIADGSQCAYTGFQFKKSADSEWRFALAPWKYRIATSGQPSADAAFYGSVLFCDAGTEYNLRLVLVDGAETATVTATKTTRAESEIPDFAALTPTRFVGVGGSDAAAGTAWATRWLTLNKAWTTANVSGTDGASGEHMVVAIGPGEFDPPSGTLATGPKSFIPSTANGAAPAVTWGDSGEVVQANWTVEPDTAKHVVVRPASSRRIAVDGTNTTWTQVSLTGPGLFGVTAGGSYTVWRKETGTFGSMKLLSFQTASSKGDLYDVPVYKRDTTSTRPFFSAAGWAEWMYTDVSWKVSDGAFGAYPDFTTNVMYLIMPPGYTNNPNTYEWLFQNENETGFSITRADTHVYGLNIRGFYNHVRHNTSSDRCVVSSCLLWGGRYPVSDQGVANSGVNSTYAVDNVVEKNVFKQTHRWRLDGTSGAQVRWRVVKDNQYGFNGTAYSSGGGNRCCEYFESSATYGLNGGSKRRVIRRNLCDGLFNGFSSGQLSGYDRYAGQDNDCYENFSIHNPDECIEFESQCINKRVWRNRGEDSSAFLAIAPVTFGPQYVIRNEAWNMGNRGSVPDGGSSLGQSNSDYHKPGSNHGKYGSVLTSWPGVVLYLHNAFYTTQGAATGTIASGCHHMAKAASGTGCCFYSRNNIIRVSGTTEILEQTTVGIALTWNGDYDFYCEGTEGTSNAFEFDGSNQTTIAGVRTQMAAGGCPTDGRYTNANKIGGVDYDQEGAAALALVDANLADPADGDLSLTALSVFKNAGFPIPNVSDVSGDGSKLFHFTGTAPNLGHEQ